MSLASQTARTSTNQSMALTLHWFIHELEKSSRPLQPAEALNIINDRLSLYERSRLQKAERERIASERNDEVVR